MFFVTFQSNDNSFLFYLKTKFFKYNQIVIHMIIDLNIKKFVAMVTYSSLALSGIYLTTKARSLVKV